jgi:hypothetical protein
MFSNLLNDNLDINIIELSLLEENNGKSFIKVSIKISYTNLELL